MGRRISKDFAGGTASDEDTYWNEAYQALEMRKAGSSNPYEQHVWDVRYVDAPVLRYRDADGNTGTGTGGMEETLYATTPPTSPSCSLTPAPPSPEDASCPCTDEYPTSSPTHAAAVPEGPTQHGSYSVGISLVSWIRDRSRGTNVSSMCAYLKADPNYPKAWGNSTQQGKYAKCKKCMNTAVPGVDFSRLGWQ